MFGRTPRLPIDVIFKSVLRDDLNVSLPKYVESLNRDLKDALAVAEANAFKEQSHQARMYNRRNKGGNIEVGDRVLLANKSERGKRKLSDKWDSVVYTVVDRDPKTHIYRIKHPLSGQLKVVHRNLLLCVNFLPVCDIVGTNDDESVFSVDDGASDECSVTSDDSTPNGVDLVVADSVADNGLQMDRSGDAPDSAEVVSKVGFLEILLQIIQSIKKVWKWLMSAILILLLMVLWMVLSCRATDRGLADCWNQSIVLFLLWISRLCFTQESKLLVNGPFQFSV